MGSIPTLRTLDSALHFYLGMTRAHADFKKIVGQANHYLVTLELGLESLEEFGRPPNSYFAPMWNPKSEKSSLIRSQDYLLAAAMAWSVDCVDEYLGELARARRLVHPKLRCEILINDRSVQKEVDAIVGHFALDECYLSAMMHVLIQWRNNLTHARARNVLRPKMRQLLLDNERLILRRHRKLDIVRMLDRFDRAEYPHFKEVAGLLKAAHDLVGLIDRMVGKEIHMRRFLLARLKVYFRENRNLQGLGNVFSASDKRKQNYVGQILKGFGLVVAEAKPKLPEKAFISYEDIISLFPDFDTVKRYAGR